MKPTVLIVDDFASVRLYHMSFLTRKGYACIGAADGAEALLKIRQQAVDLVLLDLVMPGMNGGTFVGELAADPVFNSLPVLVITSEEALAHTLLGPTRRPYAVLAKPVMPDVLLQRVQQLLADAPRSSTAETSSP